MDNKLVKKMLKHYRAGLLSTEEFIKFIEGLSEDSKRKSEADKKD